MDPLTLGFEQALHDANRADRADPVGAAQLAAALDAVLRASPHRLRRALVVTPADAARIELRRDGDARFLVRDGGKWRWEGSSEDAWSGVVAASLTAWATS
ncbi:MAG: hypothetical protein KF729_30190 [Sandaracinaceae bacterium]|nr:hypothetical protein [Sandaracinaceae bacterium]